VETSVTKDVLRPPRAHPVLLREDTKMKLSVGIELKTSTRPSQCYYQTPETNSCEAPWYAFACRLPADLVVV
jgi:hypothetical protein